MSDQDKISPYNDYNIYQISEEKKRKKINLGIISWSNIKLSKLTI